MKQFAALFLLLFLGACTSSYPLKSVDYNDLFTDGNSKVWVIEKQVLRGVNVAPYEKWSKDALIFHSNGRVDYISLKAIGHKEPKRGTYYLDSDTREISINFEDEQWFFNLPFLKEDRVILAPAKNSDVRFKLELIPLPEL